MRDNAVALFMFRNFKLVVMCCG